MRIPRITIKSLLVAVAVVAVDCFLVVRVFAGVLLPAIALNLGLIRIIRREAGRRRFWIGFEVVGLLTLSIYVGLAVNDQEFAAQWPTDVVNFVVERLPAPAQEFVNQRLAGLWDFQDDPVGFYVVTILLTEGTIGIPLVLISALGGWIWTRIGSRPITPVVVSGEV